MKIYELSIKRPVYVTVLFLVVAILGFLGFRSLQAELMPKFTPPSLNVMMVYPGASPAEVEKSLTRRLEDALSSMQGIESMRSFSSEGVSMLFVSFVYGTDIDKAMTDAFNKISSQKAQLPSSVLPPVINKITVDDKSVMTLALRSSLELSEFSDMVERRLVPEFLRIPGVAKVETVGARPEEIQVDMNLEAMNAMGISPVQILGAIRSANIDVPAGSLKDEHASTSIRLSGRLASVQQMRSLVLMTMQDGAQICLGDVAVVESRPKDMDQFARINGEAGILLNIFKQSDANAISLSDDVVKASREMERLYRGSGLKVETVSDTSSFTRDSIKSVFVDLFLAVLLVTLVMLVFLHDMRNALIVMLVVPLSLIGSFVGMWLFGFTLNLMSLLGMSVVIGVLVDDAIVVIENVYRHMEMGKTPTEATLDAMREISYTIVTVTVALVVVFLPVALTGSLVSDILRQFCGVIIFSILFSLLAALTVVPLLTSRYGRTGSGTNGFDKALNRFSDGVSDLLRWSLSRKKWVWVAVLALTVCICALFPLGFIGFEFMPDVDRSEFTLLLEMPKDISMNESSAFVAKAESWLLDRNEVTEVVSTVRQAYLAELTVKMVPPSRRDCTVKSYSSALRKELSDYLVDAKVRTFPAPLHGAANTPDLEYIACASEPDSLAAFCDYALSVLKNIPGTTQQHLSTGGGMPEVEVTVDRDRLSALGLTLDNVALTMQLVFQGNSTLRFVRGEDEYDINIRAGRHHRDDISDISGLTFINAHGGTVTLDQFADIAAGTGPGRLERYNRNPSMTISSNMAGVSPGEVSRQFLQSVGGRADAMGVSLSASGNIKSMSESMNTMVMALLLSIVLMYLALVLLYNNWTDPLVVMISIPFSVLGAIAALALSATSLNIYAMLGLVMLVGLVAKNAILLVDFASERLSQGEPVDEALIEAVRMRTRPILMTALSTVIGMIPVAVASGSSAELRNGIGWVIIGGMSLSTLLTLIVVSVVFRLFHKNA